MSLVETQLTTPAYITAAGRASLAERTAAYGIPYKQYLS